MPLDWQRYCPRKLIPQTAQIIAEAIRKFPEQNQITQLYKYLISELTPLFCAEVQSKTLPADLALSSMTHLLNSFLVYNCDGSLETDRREQEMVKSDEWKKLVDEIARIHSAGQPQGQPGETTGHKDAKPATEPPREESKKRGPKEYVVPTTGVTLRKRKPPKKPGAHTKRPEEKRAFSIVNGVKEELPEFQRGFKILQELRRKHPGDPTRLKNELLSQKFEERLAKELMEPRTTALSACCRYVGGTKKYVGDKRISGKAVYNDWQRSH